MYYKASLDSLAKFITIFCIAAFVFVIGLNLLYVVSANALMYEMFIRSAIIIFILAVFLLCFLFSPKGYILTGDSITIVRRGKNLSIFLSEIEAVNEIGKSDLSFLARTFAVGGLFGYFGRYYSSALGTLFFYTTQRRNRILIVTRKKLKIVISPDDMTLFEDLRKSLESSIRGYR